MVGDLCLHNCESCRKLAAWIKILRFSKEIGGKVPNREVTNQSKVHDLTVATLGVTWLGVTRKFTRVALNLVLKR